MSTDSSSSSSRSSKADDMLVTPITPTHPYEDLPPILTITPPSLPTFPPSPVSAAPDRSPPPKPIPPLPATPLEPVYPFTLSHHSLHAPLTTHLTLLHPQTPRDIIRFVATRLLSSDRPYGYEGDWAPFWEWCGDLSAAGLALEAGKGCEQKEDGEGKEVDRKLEEMYAVARRSWVLLKEKVGEGSAL